jgi:hypothetical protein
MVLKHRLIPHMGMHGPFRRMIAEALGSSPPESTFQKATPILLGGSVLPFSWRPLETSL